MKLVLSPAKSLDFESALPTSMYTEPVFLKEAETINKALKKKSVKSLASLMSISDKLAQLNWERNQEFELPFTPANARPAIYAFNGDVYSGLDAYSLPKETLDRLQDTVRILSGLYGVLKPLDLMQPYRLEMGTSFTVNGSKDLYAFWKPKITKALNKELEEEAFLLNLASVEYFSAVDRKKIQVPVVDVAFKDWKGDKLKVISFFAKKARGSMARYIVEQGITDLEGVKAFTGEGYTFDPGRSTAAELVFVR